MKKWLKESEEALQQAIEIADRGGVPNQNLYRLAHLVYSERNHTKNDRMLQEMARETERQVQQDCKYDEHSIEQYKYHFVSSYLFGYVVAGKMDELKYDKVMEHVTGNMELFTDDYQPW